MARRAVRFPGAAEQSGFHDCRTPHPRGRHRRNNGRVHLAGPDDLPPPAATGRLLLKRPGYEVDFERVIEKARQRGCFFEINSSPDRLDLSAENARRTAAAGVLIAIFVGSAFQVSYAANLNVGESYVNLQPTKAPIEVVVIDRIEKKPIEN